MDKLTICNLALSACKKDALASLGDDTPEANECKLWYDRAMGQVLESHNFGVATVRKELAQMATAPLAGWAYKFKLPTDCLRVIALNESDGGKTDAYDIEGTGLSTNAETALIKYISNKEALKGELLGMAIAARLAFLIAPKMGMTPKQRGDKLKEATFHLNEAINHDTGQDPPEVVEECTLITEHRFGEDV